MPLSNKIFLFFFMCLSMPQLIAMEAISLDDPPSVDLDQKISQITMNNLIHIPKLAELLQYQEQLFNLQERFINKTISKEDYAQELQGLDSTLPKLVNKIFNLPELKKYTELISAYITYLIKQTDQPNNVEQKIKILNSLYKNYSAIRQQCLWLEDKVTVTYHKIITMPLEPTATQKNRHTISKEDFGYNRLFPDYSFVNILHNVCNALEEQQRLSEIIACMNYMLKNLIVKIRVCEDLADKVSEGQKSVEGRYVAYMFGTLIRGDESTFEKLQAFALPFMNHANEEIKNIGRFAYARSVFDRAVSDYLQLEKIFFTIHAQSRLNAMEETALSDTQHNLVRNFLPVPFFQFPHYLNIFNTHLINVYKKEFSEKTKALQVLFNLTEEFMQQLNEHKSEYTRNYKKLKGTLRNEIVKCPQSAIITKTEYLKESLLSSYSLDNAFKDADLPHYGLVDKEQRQLLEKIQKERKSELPQTTPDLFVCLPHPKPQKQQPKHAKKKRNRRKNQKRRQQNSEDKEKEKDITENPSASNIASISLGAKKIAKRIFDEKNNMTLYAYCTHGIDHTAGKHINYDDRVQKWFSKPEEALQEKNFASDDSRRLTSIPFHSFCRDIDKYALKWGFKKEALNMRGEPVTEIMLPCVFEKEGESTEGLCEYVIDKKKLCYHRFFKSGDWHKKLAQEWQIDFNE